MSECFYVFLCILTLKLAFWTNILLNVKCIGWRLSFNVYMLFIECCLQLNNYKHGDDAKL